MLQVQYIRENKEATIKALHKKGFHITHQTLDGLLMLDNEVKGHTKSIDECNANANIYTQNIKALRIDGGLEVNSEKIRQWKDLAFDNESVFHRQTVYLSIAKSKLSDILQTLPNLPHASVPEGKTHKDNELVLKNVDFMPYLPENAHPHWDLIKKYDLIDFELGNKITGAGFPVYKGKGARIQRALINFFLDEAVAAGYSEVQVPHLVNKESAFATGQLPDKDGQMYLATQDNLYLIPTGEIPITNIYRDKILQEKDLPIKNVGYTPCFRREAGSWGADVRGLNRLHQFDKVELVRIEKPENSYQALEEMSLYVQSLLIKLALPYRVLRLCGGDMSFTSALTYDMEVWSGGQKKWLEVSSVSNFETYQANRLKLRMKTDGKSQLLHTLNGSALALPRVLAAILENNQTPEGIKIPKALVPYCGFDLISSK